MSSTCATLLVGKLGNKGAQQVHLLRYARRDAKRRRSYARFALDRKKKTRVFAIYSHQVMNSCETN